MAGQVPLIAREIASAVVQLAENVPQFAGTAQAFIQSPLTGIYVSVEVLNCTAMRSLIYNGLLPVSSGDVISSRGGYLETGFISFIASIYNLALAVIYAIGALVTFGSDDEINFLAKKFLMVFCVSVLSMGTSVIGVVSPYAARACTSGILELFLNNSAAITWFLDSSLADIGAAAGGPGAAQDERLRALQAQIAAFRAQIAAFRAQMNNIVPGGIGAAAGQAFAGAPVGPRLLGF